ncbi:GNAT family N-acetyltransferase [Janthinobacterium sp. BJB412]|nr:GNAT family N-acetyltransferase [Janthinobacterium sp. BJB412]
MELDVRLAAVTEENFEDIIELPLLKHQEDYLASNAYSIAQASFYPDFQARAIYAGAELVGFLMYDRQSNDRVGEYGIYRFMVDHRRQGKGIGRRAMELVLAEIRACADVARITICYHPENPVAKDFYASFGFVEVGLDDDHEMIAEIMVGAAGAKT